MGVKIESAIAWAVAIAADETHGYDQTNRWGPDYDCSAFVITAWEQAGVPVKSSGATNTRNIYTIFKNCGFIDVTADVNLSTGSGLQRGDIVLKPAAHVEMWTGSQLVGASINENGGITGGQTGDQTGKEIRLTDYWNYPWTYVLRYPETGSLSVWMGWTPNESLYQYGTPAALSINGDSGKAYGMYQFDYRYGLVPFMQLAIQYYPVEFAGFNEFISYGVGNESLIANSSLKALFVNYANNHTEKFLYVQNLAGVDDYLQPAIDYIANNYGYDITEKGSVVLGSLFSMAIRSGYVTAAQKYSSCAAMSAVNIINQTYDTYGSNDAGRWETGTSISQRDKALAALESGADIYDLFSGQLQPDLPHQNKKKSLSLLMMYLAVKR